MSEEDFFEIKNRLEKFVQRNNDEDEIRSRIQEIYQEFGIKAKPFAYNAKLDRPEESGELTFFSLEEQLKHLENQACDLAVNRLGLPKEVINPKTGEVVDSLDTTTRLEIYRQMIRTKIREAELLGLFVPYYDLGSSKRLPPYSARRLLLYKNFQDKKISKEEYQRQQNLYWLENDPKFSNKTPPILEGETFNPEEEFKKVWKARGKERRQNYEVFKQKLSYQLEGWANLRQRILQDIDFDPDIPKEELEKVLSQHSQRYGFSDQGVEFAKSFIKNYVKRRSIIKRIPEIFPNPKEFCQRFSGVKPKGDVEMSVRGISVILKFFDQDDFLKILKSSSSIVENGQPTIASPELTVGALLFNTRIPYLNGHIIILDASNPNLLSSLVHEEQHVLFNFLRPLEEKNMLNLGAFPRSYQDADKETFDESKKIFVKYLTKERNKALLLAVDEIFAFKRDNRFNSSQILNRLTDRITGIYDFTRDLREKLMKDPKPLGRLAFFSVYSWTKRILIDEYDKILGEALDAFDNLVQEGYSIEQAIGLLTLTPPWKWKRSVKMILSARQKS